jgi:tRNA A-37 threonylcarbamoyl transferase component Bud32
MSYLKYNVSFKEFMMHEFVYNLSIVSEGVLNVPKILDYDIDTQEMTMENVPHMCISDYYGEKASDITPQLFNRIRTIIRYLYANHVIYPDITGYNFIDCDDKLWIIDFEHSDFKTHQKNIFVEEFILHDHYNKWNPWFS